MSELNFGRLEITERLHSLLNIMNSHVWSVCAALPRPIRDSAVLWLQKHYAGFHPDDARSFLLRFFHPPAWTVIEHLHQANELPSGTLRTLLEAQASAMLAHMLDDHIVDGQVQSSHLALHLRTAYWQNFTETLREDQTNRGIRNDIVGECVETYLAGVHNAKTSADGEEYRAKFLKQAATWLIAPMLAADEEDRATLRRMYENFALAWRLLDDLRDAPGDAAEGAGTAVYFALDEEARKTWRAGAEKEIAELLNESGTAEALLSEIGDRLALAAADARRLKLEGLALEYEALARLRDGSEIA